MRETRLTFRSLDQPDQTGQATITNGQRVTLAFSPALSLSLREAERMGREALEMGKGVGGTPVEGLARTAWGWSDELVMMAAIGLPASSLTLQKTGPSLTLRVRYEDERASLMLAPGEFDEAAAQELAAALQDAR
ncbi:MAG: hypothetical protein GXP41_04920 [Chloroflexi bacterium]|nr:hypothetical protein [Chloroflexota bacterium]